MRLITALLLTVLLLPAARAQTPGDCETGRAQADLDVSDVRARLFNTGTLFYGNNEEGIYKVPKSQDVTAIYAMSLWTGGTVSGQLRVAGTYYGNHEFWPGPLDDGGELPDPGDCSAFDRIYAVSVLDVQQYDDTGVAAADLAEWPIGLGAPAVDAEGIPIETDDRDRVLDLATGERPVISGSQTAFWVMNDVGNDHENFGTAPLGLEVAVTAFATVSDEAALNQATVYRYAITNKSPNTIDDFAVGFFADPDLGEYYDDYVSVDTTRNMPFVYNGADEDPVYGIPPALGYDFLSGEHHASTTTTGSIGPDSEPSTAIGAYNRLLGRWNDGTPITEFGNGYMTDGDATTFAFAGDPVTLSFWSEENLDGNGTNSQPSDRNQFISAAPETLEPGATWTVDLALVFGQGADRLDSITALRTASDRVQAAYDDGSLFDTGPPPVLLATPAPTAPADGAAFEGDAPITLAWSAVPGATAYLVQLSTDPAFSLDTEATLVNDGTSLETSAPVGGEPVVTYWRVRAEAAGALSFFSEPRAFTTLNVAADFVGEGTGIVEVARPEGTVCPDGSGDAGCALDLGNTVFNDTDASSDYAVGTDIDRGIERLRRYVASAAPADFEMRFTDAGGYGLDFGAVPDGAAVWQVPFELWNVGDLDDPSDDVRMIPLVIREEGTDYDWADTFPRVDPVSGAPATARVYWMMPDRPGGYALFETAAIASGGAGQPFVDSDVTDTPLDPDALLVGDTDPSTGLTCANTGGYVSFCYRNTESSPVSGASAPGSDFVHPIGRVTLVDLAGDGTTPPAGTVIRFLTTDVGDFLVADEGGPAETAGGATLAGVRPNPSRGAAVVPFALSAAGSVRLSVVDVLGREVAVLAEGAFAAGAHEASLDGGRLASGVYVVVLEAGGGRLTRTVTMTR